MEPKKPLTLYVRLEDLALIESEDNTFQEVGISRECTLNDVLHAISRMPAFGSIVVDEGQPVPYKDGNVNHDYSPAMLSSQVEKILVGKHSYTLDFRITTLNKDTPLKVAFRRDGPVGGDETAAYTAMFSRECTIEEVVNLILAFRNDWGTISYQGSPVVKYKRGKLEWEHPMWREACGFVRIRSCKAVGGWSMMNYYIK